jgi:uncharacterized protein YbjT (DUF2867 family)
MKILVTGGTGHVGSEVVKELQKRKADIRLLVRKSDAPAPAGVEAVIGDLLDPVSVAKAMDGVDKLYLLNAVLPGELTQALIAYDLAKKLKLSHVVYHSVFRVERSRMFPTSPPSWRWKALCESSTSRSRLSAPTTSCKMTRR